MASFVEDDVDFGGTRPQDMTSNIADRSAHQETPSAVPAPSNSLVNPFPWLENGEITPFEDPLLDLSCEPGSLQVPGHGLGNRYQLQEHQILEAETTLLPSTNSQYDPFLDRDVGANQLSHDYENISFDFPTNAVAGTAQQSSAYTAIRNNQPFSISCVPAGEPQPAANGPYGGSSELDSALQTSLFDSGWESMFHGVCTTDWTSPPVSHTARVTVPLTQSIDGLQPDTTSLMTTRSQHMLGDEGTADLLMPAETSEVNSTVEDAIDESKEEGPTPQMPPARPQQPFPFLELPREVRRIVYNYVYDRDFLYLYSRTRPRAQTMFVVPYTETGRPNIDEDGDIRPYDVGFQSRLTLPSYIPTVRELVALSRVNRQLRAEVYDGFLDKLLDKTPIVMSLEWFSPTAGPDGVTVRPRSMTQFGRRLYVLSMIQHLELTLCCRNNQLMDTLADNLGDISMAVGARTIGSLHVFVDMTTSFVRRNIAMLHRLMPIKVRGDIRIFLGAVAASGSDADFLMRFMAVDDVALLFDMLTDSRKTARCSHSLTLFQSSLDETVGTRITIPLRHAVVPDDCIIYEVKAKAKIKVTVNEETGRRRRKRTFDISAQRRTNWRGRLT